jgi:hypothetical protein
MGWTSLAVALVSVLAGIVLVNRRDGAEAAKPVVGKYWLPAKFVSEAGHGLVGKELSVYWGQANWYRSGSTTGYGLEGIYKANVTGYEEVSDRHELTYEDTYVDLIDLNTQRWWMASVVLSEDTRGLAMMDLYDKVGIKRKQQCRHRIGQVVVVQRAGVTVHGCIWQCHFRFPGARREFKDTKGPDQPFYHVLANANSGSRDTSSTGGTGGPEDAAAAAAAAADLLGGFGIGVGAESGGRGRMEAGAVGQETFLLAEDKVKVTMPPIPPLGQPRSGQRGGMLAEMFASFNETSGEYVPYRVHRERWGEVAIVMEGGV